MISSSVKLSSSSLITESTTALALVVSPSFLARSEIIYSMPESTSIVTYAVAGITGVYVGAEDS